MVQTMLTRKSPSSKILPFCSAMVQGFAKKSNFWILVLTLTLHLTMYQLYHHDVGCFHMYKNLAVLSLLFVWRMWVMLFMGYVSPPLHFEYCTLIYSFHFEESHIHGGLFFVLLWITACRVCYSHT